jgi:phage tail sheath protein FI
MAITTSWPGVYIQELPSLAHTIQPAPTSIAVFVGYTHPFRTLQYNTAVPLFSFADYQTNFGGFFSSPWLPDYVGHAVFQFFNNNGPMCYVVGLPAQDYYESTGTPPTLQSQGLVTAADIEVTCVGGDITFTALQPVGTESDAGTPMQVTLSNFQSSDPTASPPPLDTADIVISYGTTAETYRKVTIVNTTTAPQNYITTALQNSNLVSVQLSSTAPTAYVPSPTPPTPPPSSAGPYSLGYSGSAVAPQAGWTVINPGDFGQVFESYQSLDKVPIFNLLAVPGISDPSVTSEAVAFCERKRAFYIMDTASSQTTATSQTTAWDANSVVNDLAVSTTGTGALEPAPPISINAAVYYPWLQTTDPITQLPVLSPPSGFVAGIYGQTDASSGVWQSPAGIGTTLNGTTGVDLKGLMTDPQQGIMNQNAINCLRQFPGVGTVVFGARTTAGADPAQQQWKYVAVRRTALFIEQTLYANLTWAVFQPNFTPLWNALTQTVNAFMLTLFRQGAFAGDQPSDAFVVQCDATTTTTTDISNGIVNILVGFAPLLPAEFVVVKIAQLAGQAQS